MSAVVISDLKDFWRQKELERGRIITVQEVSLATGISYDAVSNLKQGTTTRFDSHVLGKICEIFEVPEGEVVPFLKIKYNGDA